MMELGACRLGECTFNVTGACVLNHPVEQCPNRSDPGETGGDIKEGDEIDESGRAASPSTTGRSPADLGSAVLSRPDEMPRLPSSLTMGLEEATSLMSRRHTTMVGILGLPDSGKTACLVSAYLLLARGKFEGYDYADSASLMAFEQIARGSRLWTKGDEPAQLTTHTEMADDRQAGFLHFRLRRQKDGRFFDMLMPDLPGEWSRALIDKTDSDRFAFLGSVSVIWLMVDGRAFADPKKKRYATYRAETLVERLSAILPTPRPRIILVPSWRDIGAFPTDAYQSICEEGLRYDMKIALAPIASFSFGEIPPGSGVASLIDMTLSHDRPPPDFWPDDQSAGTRTLSCFRSAA
ncbi:TRAFAC clade GTPase domain-containing protein [Paraburkholderia sp. RL17-347-BIC-D]|uniref:TRAFAC clade GTPase domain-containing protein n=1 Tax=Paraburkholderia sp. RL17-347-BIC-D TaxID=3031632 RepID=UPI0038B7C67A